MSKLETQLIAVCDTYSKNPALKVLIQFIPLGIGGAIHTVLETEINNIHQKRTKVFFDELDKGNFVVNEKLLESEDFLFK